MKLSVFTLLMLFVIGQCGVCGRANRRAGAERGGTHVEAGVPVPKLRRCMPPEVSPAAREARGERSVPSCTQPETVASRWRRRRRAVADREPTPEATGGRRSEEARLDSVTVELVGRVGNATQHPGGGGAGNDVAAERNSTLSGNASLAELIAQFKRAWPVELWASSGFFDESYLKLMNRHWLQFSPPAAAVNYALGALYILLMLLGCSGNALVVFMYIRCRSLRTPGNILVVNLAISDFFMLAKTPVFIINSFYLGPALGKTGCTVYGFLGGLTGVTSIATLSAIAFDRYSVVVRPLDPLKTLSHLRAKLLTVFTWLYACAFSIVPALDFGYGRYVPEGYLTSCSFDYLSDEPEPRYFIFVFFCAAWVAPFSIITFCYLKILRVVVSARNMAKSSEHRLSTRHVKEHAKRKAELKLAGLVVVVIILFFLSWTPYALVALLGIFGKRDVIVPIFSMVPALFCKTASCINPFIYIMSHPKFKSEFQKIACRHRSMKPSGTLRAAGVNGGSRDQLRTEAGKEISSEDEVEVLEMKNIPCGGAAAGGAREQVATVAARVAEAPPPLVSRTNSGKSFDSNVVPPPSWFKKPRFSQKRHSFQRSSSSINSIKTQPVTT